VVELIEGVLARGVERGELRPIHPKDIAALVLAPVFLMGLWKQSLGKHTTGIFSVPGVLSAHVETLLRGLRAEAPAPEPSV